MVTSVLLVLVSLVLLFWGAGRFVEGASATAQYLGISPLLVGILFVGFGTSAPEIFVSGFAAWNGNPGLGLGNALGSNIVNIGLILGVTALITPLKVCSPIIRREIPMLLLVTGLAFALLFDLELSFADGLLLFAALIVVLGWSIRQGKNDGQDPLSSEFEESLAVEMPLAKGIIWLFLGVLILIGSSRLLVWGAVDIAQILGIDDLIIGLTIVAIGTSLPELATSVTAAIKGQHDIALGNIIGSNLFNTLAVVGISGLLHPAEFPEAALWRDMVMVAALTVLLFLMAHGYGKPGRIVRLEGGMLVTIYIGYMGWLASGTLP